MGGTGKKDGKHPNPVGRYRKIYKWGPKWGIYNLESEKEHLLKEIKKAERNARAGKYPKDGPCLTKNCNDRQHIRKRYLVRNTKGQQVYLVKTFGGTGYDYFFPTDGNMREKHNENTVGEFKKDGLWYSVYWYCQAPKHDDCSHPHQ